MELNQTIYLVVPNTLGHFLHRADADDDGEQGPYFQIGAHHDGLHQHHEESIQGGDGMYGDGGYLYAGNEKGGGWGGGGSNSGVDRKASHNQSLGTCKVWLR